MKKSGRRKRLKRRTKNSQFSSFTFLFCIRFKKVMKNVKKWRTLFFQFNTGCHGTRRLVPSLLLVSPFELPRVGWVSHPFGIYNNTCVYDSVHNRHNGREGAGGSLMAGVTGDRCSVFVADHGTVQHRGTRIPTTCQLSGRTVSYT